MQQNSFHSNNIYANLDTSTSTKMQFQLYPFNNFFLTSSQQNSLQNITENQKISWHNKQKLKSLIFLCYFREFFLNIDIRKLDWNIFRAMSNFIQSRNPQQCRSYCMKLLRKFNSFKAYLKISVRRMSGIKQRIVETQSLLDDLKEKYGFNFKKFKSSSLKELKRQQNIKIIYSAQNLQVEVQGSDKKFRKQEQFKTADEYLDQQNPVKNNDLSINCQKISKEFQNSMLRPKPIKLSLPSFDNQENDIGWMAQLKITQKRQDKVENKDIWQEQKIKFKIQSQHMNFSRCLIKHNQKISQKVCGYQQGFNECLDRKQKEK